MQTIKQIYTVGYEKSKIEEFIHKLQKNNIHVVIDVREIPLSRKPGFSKSKLAEYLSHAKIKYIHVKELGTPKSLREKLKIDKDYDIFFSEYNEYIEHRLNIIEKIYQDTISYETTCIMCFERDPFQCHRKVVADKIKEIDGNGMVVNHI